MLPFSVPMMYPYTLVHERFEDFPIIQHLYLFNPITEAVLLMQRGFWITTISAEDAKRPGRSGASTRRCTPTSRPTCSCAG